MNNGGMAELIKDGVTGVLVDEPTPEAMAKGLKRALKEFAALSRNCKDEKDNVFSVENYCDILIKEYEKLVKR